MNRPRALWGCFLAVWAFTLLAYGAVTVPCSAAAAVSMAILNLAAARLLPDPLKISKAGAIFLIAAAALFAVQFLPLGPVLFPVTNGWRATHGVGSFWPGTADTFRTLLALTQLSLYVLSALLVLKLRQSGLGASTVLKGAVALLCAEALYGLVQTFADLKSIPFFGPRAAPDSASGTLVGRNNFAGLMGVGFVLAVALAWGRFSWPQRKSDDQGKPRWMRRLEGSWPWASAAALFAVAILLSHSRGGALSALAGAILLPFLHRGRASVAGAAALAAVAAGAAALTGLAPLLERFGALDPYDLTSDARWAIFATTTAAALRQPVLGFGFGSHPVAYRPYQPPSLPGQVHHAHNEYVNVFFESGAIGLILFTGALVFWFVRSWRAQRPLPGPDRLHVTAAIAGVAVTALHSLVDFDLRIPSNGILFSALIAVGAAAARSGVPRRFAVPAAVLPAVAASAVLFAGVNPVPLYEKARGSEVAEAERLTTRALGLSPFEYGAAWTFARVAQRRGDPALADRRFEAAADLFPAHPRVQREAGLWFWEAGPPGLGRASKCLHRLFEQDPSQVVQVLAEIWRPQGRAREEYDRLIPPIPAAVAAYAAFLVREGLWVRAVEVFDRGVPAAAANARHYDTFAEALDGAGQWGVEATILDRRLAVKSDAPAYAASARAWLRLKAYDLASKRAETAAQIDLGNAAWPALRGEIFRQEGRLIDAREAFTRAVEMAPMELAYREARGWVSLDSKLYDLAAEDFKVALRSRPQDRSLVVGLARSLAGLGQTASARILLDGYLRKTPDDAGVLQLRDSLPP